MTTPTLLTKLAEIEARAEKANHAGWSAKEAAPGYWDVFNSKGYYVAKGMVEPEARFIVAANTDIPALTKALRIAIEGLIECRDRVIDATDGSYRAKCTLREIGEIMGGDGG